MDAFRAKANHADEYFIYADSMDTPLYPGPSFKGLINREYFFEGDFQNKLFQYFPKVDKGYHNIETAINYCNKRFAKGRKLKNWETDAIVAYLWSLEYKIKDLKIGETEIAFIQKAINENRNNLRATSVLSFYWKAEPSTIKPDAYCEEKK